MRYVLAFANWRIPIANEHSAVHRSSFRNSQLLFAYPWPGVNHVPLEYWEKENYSASSSAYVSESQNKYWPKIEKLITHVKTLCLILTFIPPKNIPNTPPTTPNPKSRGAHRPSPHFRWGTVLRSIAGSRRLVDSRCSATDDQW